MAKIDVRVIQGRMDAGFEQLTEPQRECLRLVLAQYSSKEIAAKLGVSPSAVDKRIERAVQVLGVQSRFAAARLLAQQEGAMSDRVPWQSIDVPTPLPDEQTGPAEGSWGLIRRLVGMPARRDAGSARVSLSVPQRLGLLLVLMLAIAVTSMALLNLGTTLSSLLGAHGSLRLR